MTDRDEKEIMKEAIKEWLDEQYAKFGKYILGKLLFAAFCAAMAWYLSSHGIKFP